MFLFGDSLIFYLLCICSCLLIAIYTLLVYQQNNWTKKGIPYSNIYPILGNIQDVFLRGKKLHDVVKDFYLQHKNKPFIGFFSFNTPTVMINDVELIKSVLVKDFSSFADRNFSLGEHDPMEHYSIFGAKGQEWRDLRSKLSPTFSSGKLKRMYQLVDECARDLVACLDRERDETGELDAKETFSRYATDVIASVTFGIEGNALKDSTNLFRQMMKRAVSFDFPQNIVLGFASLFPSLIDKLRIPLTNPEVADFFRKAVWDNVEYRKKNKVSRNDFLELMIQIRDKGCLNDDSLDGGETLEQSDRKIDLDGDKFVAQCYIFLTAGFESSSQTMTFAMYEMSRNMDIQTRVYDEIETVIAKHDGKVTYEAIQEMEYLHMVLQETLRMYPDLHFLDRAVTRPYRVPGTGIELAVGDSVMVPVIGLHYDPELYPEPQRFDPERFSEEQKKARPPCTFLGFGDGPRMCIATRLAYMQVKLGLIYTLRTFEIVSCTSTPVPLKFKNSAPFNILDGRVPLRFKKRSTI